MKEKLRRIWKVVKNLPRIGKIGIFLWAIGYPIGTVGIILLAMGHYEIGIILFFIPWIEGNLGMVLAGKGAITSIKKEFFSKKTDEKKAL
jgi:hypothetical protein